LLKSGVLWLTNRLRFGRNAPDPAIRLTIPPQILQNRYHESANQGFRMPHWRTGQILGGDWDLSARKLILSVKFKACRKHFIKGIPWEKTGIIRYGLKRIAAQTKYDNCVNENELIARYARLDDLWDKTTRAGALPAKLTKTARLRDCIVVHMARDGSLIFGNQGFHRLAIARLAKIETITVLLGVTHEDAVRSGAAAKTIADYRYVETNVPKPQEPAP
jgi:hypothetical protein